ncbi:family 2 glycosyl transferase [Desulfovibrio ferrophilus]|uniref:Family 2 glycosyl transferase n=1 Tax=Desulfovibrio ferrophilus TaxID=241368 RepID=A0A2Z6B0M0_9BACT|nr:family 2 glycosyl transferase [Desulfovibrio ferrophilus]
MIPVFNEEANLPVLHKEISTALTGIKPSWEVIYINDASTDNSLAVIRDLAAKDEHVRYLSFRENRGQSAGFAAGFQHATGDVVVTLDADLQNDPADIPSMLAMYDAEGADMVIGWRTTRKDTAVKRLSSRIGNAARNWWTRETVHDTGCSLKVMRTEMARRMPMFKNMHRYLPTLMKMQKAKVMETPVNHRHRMHGESKYGTWDRLKAGLYDLIGVRWLLDRAIDYDIEDQK